MNNKEALWFVGKCLSLCIHPERASEIKEYIQSGRVEWALVVYQSSNQFVLPALYLNLKRNHLLSILPEELLTHFEEITNLNRERNESILRQLRKITTLLNENGLKPIFLKGTAHLLSGLYEDIGERMIGDIDFLLEENEALRAFDILAENGYSSISKADPTFGNSQHLPRLIKGQEAAVEIHRRMLNGTHNKYFGWLHVKDQLRPPKGLARALVFSDTDLILHNIFNAQIKDKGKSLFKIFLRQSYDLMLLSKKQDPIVAIKHFGHNFNTLNTYLALSAHLLDFPSVLSFEENFSAKHYVRSIHFIWDNPKLSRLGQLIHFLSFRIYRYLKTFLLFFISSSTRKRVITSLSDPSYYGKHFAQYKVWFKQH